MKSLTKNVLLSTVMVLFIVPCLKGQTPLLQDALKIKKIKANTIKYVEQGGQIDVVPEFSTKAEKDAWFNNLSASQILPNGDYMLPTRESARVKIIFPDISTFPKYVNTGNQDLDDQNYDQQKQIWINQNQDQYNSMVQPASDPISHNKRLKLDLQPQN